MAEPEVDLNPVTLADGSSHAERISRNASTRILNAGVDEPCT